MQIQKRRKRVKVHRNFKLSPQLDSALRKHAAKLDVSQTQIVEQGTWKEIVSAVNASARQQSGHRLLTKPNTKTKL